MCLQNADFFCTILTKQRGEIMSINSPADIVAEKEILLEYGNRLNALFLEDVMYSGDSIRRLIHSLYPSMQQTLTAFYEYSQDHDYDSLCTKIKEMTDQGLRCTFCVDTDEKGHQVLHDDYSISCGKKESLWADWKKYHEKHTLIVCDEAGNGVYKKFVNKSAVEVIRDTLNNYMYSIEAPEKTGNENLDTLLNYLYNRYELVRNVWDYNTDAEWNNQAYFKALKLLNNDIVKAFSAHRPLEPESAYIKAILMMEDLSPRVFHAIEYREQRSFYRSEMAQELLKFSYLTTRKSPNIDMEHFAQFIKSVQDSDGWQEAHYKITKELISESRMNCVLNNCILDLNIIRPQPHETMYQGYYQDDVERSHYMNLYLKKGRE